MPDEVPSQDTNWEAELSAAFESDPDFNGATEQPAPAPDPETPAGDPAPAVQPPAAPAPSEPPAPPVDTFDGGEFNPDLLDPSLQPGWRQLQGAFTRKTQELAEQRKELETLAQTLGGANPDAMAQAIQLHTAISDPANWPVLYQELADLMETNGVQMPGAAPAQPVAPAAPQPAVVPAAEVDDPELAPLMDKINALQTQVDGFRAAQQEQAMIAQAEREHAARVAHFESQESRIKELYPNYKESDWNAIYTAVPFFNGDLIAAQQHFESERQRHVEAYLAGKQGAQGATLAPPTAAPAAPAEPDKQVWLRDVEEEAVEHLRALHAAGELDL